jgi:hypothetical protein
MKLVILSAFVLALTSCGKKEWSKEYMTKKCNKEFKKNNETSSVFSASQLTELCDCVADKMVTRYKSEREADKDTKGAEEIGRDCAMEVMQ